MASVTRSNRRAEGLHPHHHHHNVNVNAGGPLALSGPGPVSFHHHHHHHHNYHHNHLGNTNTAAAAAAAAAAAIAGGRMKRGLERSDRDFDSIRPPKKARIAVEILAKTHHQTSPSIEKNIAAHHGQSTPAAIRRQAAAASSSSPNGEHRPAVLGHAATNNNININKSIEGAASLAPPPPPSHLPRQDMAVTKHQAKVINGIKHELNRLQPKASDTREQGRKLRSQEASRFKSELSAYFPDYDEVIGNEPKEEHLLNPDTPIVVIDSKLSRVLPESYRNQPPHSSTDEHTQNQQVSVRGYGDALFSDVFDSQRIDFSFLEAQHKANSAEDPLPDGLFEPIHKRAERVERSIRNTEKGRAQHEKDQIIRLLEGLQGHDWLRIMGVSGVTETKKKAFEPARLHFIRGCEFILGKFRNWSVEEKRRKLEKDKAHAERTGKEGEESGRAHRHGTDDSRVIRDSEEEEEDAEDILTSQDDESEASSPAQQLHREARARSKITAVGSRKRRSSRHPEQPAKPPEPPKEFKSFFSKQYERDGALHRHRRAGRKVLAWGHPIPDIPESDFLLPEEYRDEDTLKSRARKKRRDRRESRQL